MEAKIAAKCFTHACVVAVASAFGIGAGAVLGGWFGWGLCTMCLLLMPASVVYAIVMALTYDDAKTDEALANLSARRKE